MKVIEQSNPKNSLLMLGASLVGFADLRGMPIEIGLKRTGKKLMNQGVDG